MMYRKKPVVVEAKRLTPDTVDAIGYWCGAKVWNRILPRHFRYLKIQTLEGEMVANMGDYIIKGVKGEFYPCKPDIFEMTYEQEGTMNDEDQEFNRIERESKQRKESVRAATSGAKPISADQFKKDLANIFSQAVQETYQDLVDKAIADERKAIEQELLKLKGGVGGTTDYIQGRWDVIGELQDIIRARGEA